MKAEWSIAAAHLFRLTSIAPLHDTVKAVLHGGLDIDVTLRLVVGALVDAVQLVSLGGRTKDVRLQLLVRIQVFVAVFAVVVGDLLVTHDGRF